MSQESSQKTVSFIDSTRSAAIEIKIKYSESRNILKVQNGPCIEEEVLGNNYSRTGFGRNC